MSMSLNLFSRPAARCLNPYAQVLADAVRCRRLELGLSIHRAAELSGITVWQWAAMEYAVWIPADGPVMHGIAGTLQADYDALSFWAEVSRVHQAEK